MSKKIYFVSDFHLGIDAEIPSGEREKKIVRWLDIIKEDAKELYLVGDVFDYWYEYKRVVPKGFYRLFSKLAELKELGISITFFTGNHDMWMFRYLDEELGIPILRQPIRKVIDGKTFYIGHGDGLGPGDYGYKFIKSIFNNKICQWAYGKLHPDFGLALMKFFSAKSRQYTGDEDAFTDESNEWLVQFCEQDLVKNNVDYYIFGHRHLAIQYTLSNQKSTYFNLGEWMYAYSFGVWDGQSFKLEFFESNYDKIYGNCM